MKIKLFIVSFFVLLFTGGAVFAERGVYDDKIVIGMTAPFTGPAEALGKGMKAGIEAVFNYHNSLGGIYGRKLVLKTMDDKYEPEFTAPNMRTLIEKEKVFAIIGNVGTPTAIVAIPIILETKTPMIGAFTGAGILRKNPPDRYIINYRASYAEETAAIVDGLINDIGLTIKEIAFFTQNDGYGDAGFAGGIAALKEHGLKDESKVVHVRYARNTLETEHAVDGILNAEVKPKAIIMIGTYAPCAKFIKAMKEKKFKAIFANVSFVGSKSLVEKLGSMADNVVVTQVVPHYKSTLPGVVKYRKHVKDTEQSFVSLEGYFAAMILVRGLQKTGKELTVEKFIATIESLTTLNFGTQTAIGFSKTDHQASHTVWPTIIKNEKIIPLKNWVMLKSIIE